MAELVERLCSGRVPSRSGQRSVSRLHRVRLLSGAAEAAAELGYWHTSVREIVARSGVSRGTFYALFADRDECLCAMVEELVAEVERQLGGLELDRRPWEMRVAIGLAASLRVLDSDRDLARVCVVETAKGGLQLQSLHEEVVARLASVIAEGGQSSESPGDSSLLPTILAGAVLRGVYSRLSGGRGALAGLAGELTRMIVLTYRDEPTARRASRAALGYRPRQRSRSSVRTREPRAPSRPMPIRLTYRTARVLEAIARYPGATNRAIALHAGGVDQGQISKLLRRLEDCGLIANGGEVEYKWSSNVWLLTDEGRRFVESCSHGDNSAASYREGPSGSTAAPSRQVQASSAAGNGSGSAAGAG
ncbi:MAG: TetR family transcriptional regulator [Solirubrobacteraceae bacterium]